MALSWLLFTVVAFYGCVKEPCCTEVTVTEAVTDPVTDPTPDPVAPATAADYGVVTLLGSADLLTGDQWPALRDRLVASYRDDPEQTLDVYGHYYATETAPDGYENMGFLRAEQLKELIVRETDIPADRINPLARLLDGDVPAADERWRAGQFNWRAATTDGAAPASEVIELDDDEIIIRFPLDASTKTVDAGVDGYLDKLARRLQQTDETVSITGHTDAQGSDAYNQALGQRRADFVKNLLVQKGARAASITTASRGESQPTASNATAEGRRQNRRAEVKLMAN